MYVYQVAAADFLHKTTITVPEKPEFDRIVEEICEAMEITLEELKTQTRVDPVKYGRWILWKIMFSRGATKLSLGKILGWSYDHTTVMNALEKLPDDVQKREFVRAAYIKVMQYDYNPIKIAE